MKTKNVNNAIEDWLGGRVDRAGREWLAGEMAKDPELARELNLRRKTDEIIADRQVMELRSKLNVIGRKKSAAIPLLGIIAKGARYAAAVALTALISTAIYLEMKPGASPEQLYASSYTRYESPGAVRSASGEGNALMENAIASYSAKEYEKAIIYLEQIINSDRNDMESVFMHGMANMEVKNYPVASGSFTRVIEHNDNLYLEDAEWYLGLCYMMTGNLEKASSQFSSIASSESRYKRQAAKLSRKLK